MSFRKHTRDGRSRCQSDVKRNGYWTGRQCERAAVERYDGVPLCGTHSHQRRRWALSDGRTHTSEAIEH